MIAADKEQAVMLIDIIEKWTLVQRIDKNTRNDRILDLFFTDISEEVEVDMIKNIKTSDHNLAIVNINSNVKQSTNEMRKNFYNTSIMEYKYDEMTNETIEDIKQYLSNQNWENVTVKSLTDTIEQIVTKKMHHVIISLIVILIHFYKSLSTVKATVKKEFPVP